MGKVVEKVKLRGDKGETIVSALMDSGASFSVIRRDIAQKVTTQFLNLKPRSLKMVDGSEWVTVSEAVNLEIDLRGKSLDGAFYVVEKMPREAIAGVDFMQRWEITLQPRKHEISIGVDPDSIEMA